MNTKSQTPSHLKNNHMVRRVSNFNHIKFEPSKCSSKVVLNTIEVLKKQILYLISYCLKNLSIVSTSILLVAIHCTFITIFLLKIRKLTYTNFNLCIL